MIYCRLLLAGIGTILLIVGVSLQFAAAGNLYGIPLSNMCEAYSGSKELSDAQAFTQLINTVRCATEIIACCEAHSPNIPGTTWYLSGICAKPWLTGLSQYNESMPPADKIELFTAVLGDFIGVAGPGDYLMANAEFWCKNCPNDYRKNCPFDPPPANPNEPGFQNNNLCDCPGGSLSQPGQAFWSMVQDYDLSSTYILCSDKARVYRSWITALFPSWPKDNLDHAEQQFLAKCWQVELREEGREEEQKDNDVEMEEWDMITFAVLSIFACIFSVVSIFKYFANSPMSTLGFNFAMLAVSLTLVSFWPLSFTGAAALVSRYYFCYGLSDPVVLNATSSARSRAAPTFFNGNPCFDLNSEGQHKPNPFIGQLGIYNAGYVSGGVLVVIALICMLAVVSKNAEVVLEEKLSTEQNGEQAAEPKS
ncbi:hypothetical protein GUITHDRAFT_100833 [Guillardia theta CCMP2712]|uniref:Uncharacterized protein n=1 Tax=Guillardia theta (strain CCMP2712) TaxID=905079 RepID=L1JZT6_GUITC|nr:hypothetical protein GUITHDRAFT_100833 [Guillardia theta CCMP2712]EKX53867.1 hypothetical protein GUITHDRAFT_100833 [Guillardia theta CCMP2712]|eukprot:XP_005840847.1 hypothetical protein GUITHDRAFT_100833 [Guillardia theta CCMP2712]